MTCIDTVEFIEYTFYSTARNQRKFIQLCMSAARIMNCTPEEEKEFVQKEIETRSAHLN